MGHKLFIFGYGFSSQAIARECQGQFEEIFGTSRRAEKAQSLRAEGLSGLVFNGEELSEATKAALGETTHMVVSIAPGEQDPVLAIMGNDLKAVCPSLEWVGYLSTVGVYGNHDGAWVDEDTEPKPVSQRSIQRVTAENAWLEACEAADVQCAIFRLSGIYGPGRNTFTTIETGKSRRMVKPGQVFNRIHRDDIGTAVARAIAIGATGVFNITDDMPAPPQDLVTFAHELMGREPPPEIDFETTDISSMARSFYGENKRVSNAKSKSVLDMEYQWPDYVTSLKRMWDEESWK